MQKKTNEWIENSKIDLIKVGGDIGMKNKAY